MPFEWIILIIAIGTAVLCVFSKPVIEQRMHDRKHGNEVAEPFSAEVLYRGEAIADLTDREVIEMFWHKYRIEPRTDEAKEIIEDDDLWDECIFDFRDPETGIICTSGFVGGSKPFIKDGRISLRGLYFDAKEPTTKPEKGVTNS
jgi:hypothetical protein